MKRFFFLSILTMAPCAYAQTATVNLRQAIVLTQDGQTATARLRYQWGPEAANLERQQAEMKADREKLERESKQLHGWWLWRHAMSAAVKASCQRELDSRAKDLTRRTDDDRAALETEQQRIVGHIGKRLTMLADQYAQEHGYAAILDTSQTERSVIIARNDVTGEIVKLYDAAFPAGQ